ncbi:MULTISPECIES: protein kinase [unclassified Microbacterium]|uniref:protein kinase domain-containing protein n=1 Tax=unclassified Microbacterium TaxID=2609290 RepID=UPI000B309230|nr:MULTISPECIES: protein kinase [unclassified Microbacterium]MBN9224038.1 protein kinase [Microbacterium sp.]
MARRPPSTPPQLPGFEHIKLIGSGGFADVFLYQQLHPRRRVAVKVLLAENIGKSTAESFTAEANAMAELASHPSIVSIYEAGVAGDGRPYLVMEYLSKPNLQARHRRERFSEVDTLRIGIHVAGAVETAHRAKILHRDIKPANILVTDYGRPALTDFGIAATTADQADQMAGLSIPWSPPEALTMPPDQDARSDVYSLAATLYTLLTDRSPFEVPGASNTEIDVILRIQQGALPPIGRPDVSPALEAALARALSRDRADRPVSALEFAHDLQRVQISLGLAPTPVDVVEEEVLDDVDDAGEERTRFRGVTNIDAQTSPTATSAIADATRGAPSGASRPTAPNPPLAPVAPIAGIGGMPIGAGSSDGSLDATRRPHDLAPSPHGIPDAPALSETLRRAPSLVADEVDEPPAHPKRRRGLIIGIAAAVVVVAAAAVVGAVMLGGGTTPAPPTRPTSDPVDVVDQGGVPTVVDLAGTVDGASVVFTWTNPDPRKGDVYLWRTVVPGTAEALAESTDPTVTVPADPTGRTCIEVVLRRANGASATDSVQGCAP